MHEYLEKIFLKTLKTKKISIRIMRPLSIVIHPATGGTEGSFPGSANLGRLCLLDCFDI